MWSRLALCSSLLLAVGCTRSSGSSEPTPEKLSDALVTITDLEGNWQESQRQIFTERSNENPSIDPSTWCPQAADAAQGLIELAGQAGADVEMQNKDVEGGARLMRLQAWSNADAQRYVDQVIAVVDICNGVETTDENQVTTSTSLIEGRQIGDQSVSWMSRTVPPPNTQKDKFESVGRTTVARFGDVVMVLQIGDANWTGSTEAMPETDWWAVVETAGNKLKKIG